MSNLEVVSELVSAAVSDLWWARGFYDWWGLTIVSKILLGKIVTSSFRWLLLVYSV